MAISIQKSLQKAQRIKLPGGVVGKICWVLVVFCISVTTLAAFTKSDWIIAGAVASMFLLAFPLLWRLINFADKNPQAAILEGAEFLMHQQLVLGTKENPTLGLADEMRVEARAVTLSSADVMKADTDEKKGVR